MKKHLIISLFAAILISFLFFSGCKTAEETKGEFTLTVSVSSGVAGTPETGTYNYNAGATIAYSYNIQANYSNLRVKLDGELIENSGTITISKDHALSALADTEYNIIGSWTMEEKYEDDRSFTVTVTFTGAKESGTLVDSDGGAGTYTADSTAVKFTLEFPTVKYEYTGIFTGVDEMSGSTKRISTITGELTGNWRATRDADSAALRFSPGRK